MLDVVVLGAPRFAVDGIPVTFRSRKAEGLLARLCLSPDGHLPREAAANLFWEDSSEHHARSSLRQTLLILRRNLETLGFDGLSSDKQAIAVDLARVRTDVDVLLKPGDRLPPRLLHERRLSERLFEGGEVLAEPFTAWLRVRRQQLHDELRGLLEPRIAAVDGDLSRVEDAALALLNLDPTHEPACRAFIRARAANGDYATALRAYEDLWNVLEEEFDTQPSSETQALIVEIKLGRFPEHFDLASEATASGQPGFAEAPAAAPLLPARPAGRSSAGRSADGHLVVVVDPVSAVMRAGGDGPLAEVFRYDLVARLLRFREWTVIDTVDDELERSSIPVYRIGVAAMRAEGRAAYTVTVKNHRTGHYVWGRTSEVPLDVLMSRQLSLLGEIAMATNAHISAERLQELANLPDAELDVYDRLLRGRGLLNSMRIEDSLRAEAVFSALIEEHPRYAPAYSGLAQVINARHLVFPGTSYSHRSLERASALAGTALGLDPFDCRAHSCFSWSAALQRRFGIAERHHRKALDLNDSDPWVALSAAYGLACNGHSAEALSTALRVRDRGLPFSPLQWSLFAGTMVLCGEGAAAVRAQEKAHGACLIGDAWHLAALVMTGGVEGARQQGERLCKRIRDRWVLPSRPENADIFRWIGNCLPIGSPEVWASLRDNLARAGIVLPDDLAPTDPRQQP